MRPHYCNWITFSMSQEIVLISILTIYFFMELFSHLYTNWTVVVSQVCPICHVNCLVTIHICNKKAQGTIFYINWVILIIVLSVYVHIPYVMNIHYYDNCNCLWGKFLLKFFIIANDVEPQNYFDNTNSYFMKTGCVIACSFTNFLKLCYCSSLPVMFIGQKL